MPLILNNTAGFAVGVSKSPENSESCDFPQRLIVERRDLEGHIGTVQATRTDYIYIRILQILIVSLIPEIMIGGILMSM